MNTYQITYTTRDRQAGAFHVQALSEREALELATAGIENAYTVHALQVA